MSVPLIVFLVGVGIVLYSWRLSKDLLSVPGTGVLYSVLYVLSAGAMLYAWLTTDQQLRVSIRPSNPRQGTNLGETAMIEMH